MRGKPEKFADHYSQATLFWNSQTPYEKAHIVRGFRFELTKVQVPAIRERASPCCATSPTSWRKPWPTASASPCRSPCRGLSSRPAAKVDRSPALSLTARPGDGSIRGRKIAILLAPGVDAESVIGTQEAP